jgi:hypothetical protein
MTAAENGMVSWYKQKQKGTENSPLLVFLPWGSGVKILEKIIFFYQK